MSSASSMTRHVEGYLAMRRAFGFQLTISGTILHDFARFADREAPAMPLTLGLALRWAQTTRGKQPSSAARRLCILGPFARFLRAVDPRTHLLPKGILGPGQRRYVPHIYTEGEVRDLLAAAKLLQPRGGLRPRTIQAYFSLLACTGMRPQEPTKLTRDDIDFSTHRITIRGTKFSKSRIIVVHPSVSEALQAYARCRNRHVLYPRSESFFLLDDGNALTHKKALWAFRRVRHQLGWRQQPGRDRRRLYDFRHTFVCRRLLAWYGDGVDVHVAMPSLSTYLGHVKVTDTYWYVTAIPELMEIVGSRFERFALGGNGGRQ